MISTQVWPQAKWPKMQYWYFTLFTCYLAASCAVNAVPFRHSESRPQALWILFECVVLFAHSEHMALSHAAFTVYTSVRLWVLVWRRAGLAWTFSEFCGLVKRLFGSKCSPFLDIRYDFVAWSVVDAVKMKVDWCYSALSGTIRIGRLTSFSFFKYHSRLREKSDEQNVKLELEEHLRYAVPETLFGYCRHLIL